jgi:transitional endoplasmic reticulum ATPase
MAATREFINSVDPEEAAQSVGNVRITREHFEEALEEVGPSVDEDTRERYEELEDELSPSEGPSEPEVSRTFQ